MGKVLHRLVGKRPTPDDSRPPGYYVSANDYPIHLGRHGLTHDEVMDALNFAFTPEKWEKSQEEEELRQMGERSAGRTRSAPPTS